MGAPQGCVLSPRQYSLFTHDCMAKHDSNTIIKFADDTTVVGLIIDNNEAACREEVSNLTLNVIKTEEMIVDYRKRMTEHDHILNDGAVVEQVESFKILVSTSPTNYSIMVQTRHFALRRLNRFGMGHQILKKFYSCTIESILTG